MESNASHPAAGELSTHQQVESARACPWVDPGRGPLGGANGRSGSFVDSPGHAF
jgi:hypothetical protein